MRHLKSGVGAVWHAVRCSLWPLALALTLVGIGQAQTPASGEALAHVVQQAVANGLAGEVLVADADRMWFEQAFGFADQQHQQPHRVGATWRWASVSKQVAAALVMQQVDAGMLRLDDTLAQRLPGFAAPNAASITLRQLLQHTSGLPNPSDTPPGASAGTSTGADEVPAFYLREGDAAALEASALRYCAGTPKHAPGSAFDYNNCDTLVLGAVLARALGQPYSDIVRERIAVPLGLPTLRLVEGEETAAQVAFNPPANMPNAGQTDQARPGNTVNPGHKTQAVPQPRLATFGASAALEGSARELLAFDRALLSNRLVSPTATREMWAGEPRWGYAALGAWGFEAKPAGCAKAVKLVERRGDVGGIQVRNLIAPESGVSIIVFSNNAALEFGEIWQGRGLMHDLAAAALCPPPSPAPSAAPVSSQSRSP